MAELGTRRTFGPLDGAEPLGEQLSMRLFALPILLPFSGKVAKVKRHVGWQEWAGLPDLGLQRLQVKIDTGARTSSLHVWEVQPGGVAEEPDGKLTPMLRIRIDADYEESGRTKVVLAPLVRYAVVTDSGGRQERRPVIRTRLVLGGAAKTVEVNLTNRELMRFRMIVGRSALDGDFLVDVNEEFLMGPPEAGAP